MLDFLNNILSLLVSFLDVSFLNLWFFPMIALAFICSIPSIIRILTTWR